MNMLEYKKLLVGDLVRCNAVGRGDVTPGKLYCVTTIYYVEGSVWIRGNNDKGVALHHSYLDVYYGDESLPPKRPTQAEINALMEMII